MNKRPISLTQQQQKSQHYTVRQRIPKTPLRLSLRSGYMPEEPAHLHFRLKASYSKDKVGL